MWIEVELVKLIGASWMSRRYQAKVRGKLYIYAQSKGLRSSMKSAG
jgi:hypothetical protein